MKFKLTNEFLNTLKEKITHKNDKEVSGMLRNLFPADIAEIYGEIDINDAKYINGLIDNELAADVLMEMEDDERERFLNVFSGEEIAKEFIEQLDSDDAADLIAELPDNKKKEVLKNIDDAAQAGDIVDLLNYDENSAGGLMAKELIKANENWDVTTCIKEIRKQSEEVDELYFVYVVDDDNKLKGTLSLKKLLISRPNTKIKNILNTDKIYVNANTSSEEVANIIKKYDLVAIPVVDSIGRLLGRITVDDVVDVMQEEAEKDYQMISGISEDVEPSDKIFILTRARLPWLMIGLLGGILGSRVVSMFESELKVDPKMAFFMPLIAAMGGNVGVQSSSIVVQGIANKSLDLQSTSRKILKEISIALINGSILSGLLLLYNIIFTHSLALTITVSTALFSVIVFASTFGTFVPLILHRLKIDPALATGPFITTTNDIIGILIYFGIGRFMYNIF